MPLLPRLTHLLRGLTAPQRRDRDLDDELHAYLDHVADEKVAAGMDRAEARRAAAIEMGGVEQVKEEVRHARVGHLLDETLQDLRYGARALRKSPAYTIVAVVALALGIGANTAVFSVANGLLLQPLPYGHANRVAVVFMRYVPRDFAFGTMSMRDFLIWRDNNHAFDPPALFQGMRMDIGSTGSLPEQIQGHGVTSRFFPTLEARPLIGRTLAEGEDQPGANSVVVIGEGLWRRRFAASASVLGRAILVNGKPTTVIGVMPQSFQFPSRQTEAWINLRITPPTRFGPWLYRGVARLKPGVTFEQAQQETNQIAQRIMQQNSFYQRLSLPLLPLRAAILGNNLKPAILILTGAVALVLLIALVNVANLNLVRATIREREMALRLSLGAGRARLVRQLLIESGLLAIMGGVAGLSVAWGGITSIRVWNPGNLPLIESVRLDPRALAFTLLVSLITGVLVGLLPALQSSRADLHSTIKEGGRGTSSASHARVRARSVLVVGEIALSLMLLIGAGLLLRSFVNLQQVTGGFAAPPNRVLTMFVSPGNRKYIAAPAGLSFYDEVLRRARAVPGVEMAAVTDSLPPEQQGDADSFAIEGQSLAPGAINPIVTDATVSPGFFEALRVPLVKGRTFTNHDDAASVPVTIVSEGFAQRFFPGQDPIGKRIMQSGTTFGNPWLQIVGVVGNVKYLGLAVDTDPAYYLAFAQSYGPRVYLVVRTSADAASLAPAVRSGIQSVDPGVTVAQVTTMEQSMASSMAQPRFDTLFLGIFAAIALLLAAAGIYGLIAYSVAQRTQEIGVRMALGAAQSDVLVMVVRQGATLAAVGVALGLSGAYALTRLLKSMLFDIAATDGLAFAGAAFAIILVVLLATLAPALRATRISPTVALRYE